MVGLRSCRLKLQSAVSSGNRKPGWQTNNSKSARAIHRLSFTILYHFFKIEKSKLFFKFYGYFIFLKFRGVPACSGFSTYGAWFRSSYQLFFGLRQKC